MPQMSPMMWLILNFYFFILLIFSIIICYFIFMKTNSLKNKIFFKKFFLIKW